MLTPISLLTSLFMGLIALALPVIGVLLLWKAAHPRTKFVPVARTRERVDRSPNRRPERHSAVSEKMRPLRWSERWREPAALIPLLIGSLLVLLPLGGGRIMLQYAFRAGDDEPHVLRGEVQELARWDGTKIHVEVFGHDNAPQLLLTHGWGTNSTEWYYAKRQLAGRFASSCGTCLG